MKTEFGCNCGTRWSAEVPGDAVPTVTQVERTSITGPDGKEYPIKNEQGKTVARFEKGKDGSYAPVYA